MTQVIVAGALKGNCSRCERLRIAWTFLDPGGYPRPRVHGCVTACQAGCETHNLRPVGSGDYYDVGDQIIPQARAL